MKAASRTRLVEPSRRLLALFDLYLRWYIGRHFHALRVAHRERFPLAVQGPFIIYLNHPSWWDPLTCIMISRHFLPLADHYAPMDEAALRRYKFFAKLGLFPVEQNTARGAMQFMRYSAQIAAAANSVLWLTPEGHFADARVQPPVFREGISAVLSRIGNATVLPLSLEYVFWDERLPEILVNCGVPIRISEGDKYSAAHCNQTLTAALSATQQELASLAITRDSSHFEAILNGGAGVGAIYDLWRRIRSSIRGEQYEPEHASIHRP